MAGIYAVGARSSITKSKLYPIGSHIVVGSSRATAIGIEEGSFYIFAAGDKADSDEMAALVMEGAAHTAAGTWLTHDQVNRIHELKLSALGEFVNFDRAAILQHVHVKNLVELSVVGPVVTRDPLVGVLIGASLAVLDASGDPLIINDGKVVGKEGNKYRVTSVSDASATGLAGHASISQAVAEGVAMRGIIAAVPTVDISGADANLKAALCLLQATASANLGQDLVLESDFVAVLEQTTLKSVVSSLQNVTDTKVRTTTLASLCRALSQTTGGRVPSILSKVPKDLGIALHALASQAVVPPGGGGGPRPVPVPQASLADRYPLTWALRSLALDDNVFEQMLSDSMEVFEPKRATALRKSSITMYGACEARLRRLKLTPLAISTMAPATSLDFDEIWVYVIRWAPEVQSAEGQSSESLIAAAIAATQSVAMGSSDTRNHDKATPEEDAQRTALRSAAINVCKDPVKVQRLQALQALSTSEDLEKFNEELIKETDAELRLLIESPVENYHHAISGAVTEVNMNVINGIRRARITEMERAVLGKTREVPSAHLRSAIKMAGSLRLTKLQLPALANILCDKSTASEPLAAFAKCSGDGLKEFAVAKDRLTTILMNRLPLQSQKIDLFWKQVKKRVDKEIPLGTTWLSLSRWLSLMLEDMESPSTSAVASINFSIDVDFKPLSAAEAILSEMKIDDKLSSVRKGGPSGVKPDPKLTDVVDKRGAPTIPAGQKLKPGFKKEAWTAAKAHMDATIGDKGGKQPCPNYFITQGYCPYPSTCKYHHVGKAGVCSPADTERHPASNSKGKRKRGGK